jgi:nitroreductase
MDAFEAVRTLLAVRSYQDRPVPAEVVRRIVEAGRLTGSAMNRQPWHFVVVQDAGMLRRLGAAASSGPYVAQAPLAIVVAVERTAYAVSEKVGPLLGIPATLDVLAILPLGYPAKAVGRGKKARRALSAIASRERYGQPFA